MIKNVLKNLGLNEKEISVYLSSLQLGPQPASVLAKSSGLNRSTAYVILESLFKKGVISQFVKAEIKYFSVISPQNLVSYVERNISDMRKTKDDLISIIPEFLAMTNSINAKPKVGFFEGVMGAREVYEEISNIKSDIYSICIYELSFKAEKSSPSLVIKPENLLKRILNGSHAKSVIFANKKNIQSAKKYFSKNSKNTKILTNQSFPKELEIHIYGNKTAFFVYNQNDVLGVVIEDKIIIQAMKEIFKMIGRNEE